MKMYILENIFGFGFVIACITLTISSFQLSKLEKNWAILFTSWEIFRVAREEKKKPNKKRGELLKRIKYSMVFSIICFLGFGTLQWINSIN